MYLILNSAQVSSLHYVISPNELSVSKLNYFFTHFPGLVLPNKAYGYCTFGYIGETSLLKESFNSPLVSVCLLS